MENHPYGKYLREIRYRFYYLCFSLLLASLTAYLERDLLCYLITEPLRLPREGLLFLRVTEAFNAQVYLSITAGFLAVSPLIWLQSWLFLANSLHKREQYFLGRLIIASLFFLGCGLLATKNFLLPRAWFFFLSFASFESTESLVQDLTYYPSILPYIQLSLTVYQAILVSSQLPLFFFLLLHWGWARREDLEGARPWVVMGLLIWAALFSPPDLGSQLFLFLPLFFIYEIFIFLLHFNNARRRLKT